MATTMAMNLANGRLGFEPRVAVAAGKRVKEDDEVIYPLIDGEDTDEVFYGDTAYPRKYS